MKEKQRGDCAEMKTYQRNRSDPIDAWPHRLRVKSGCFRDCTLTSGIFDRRFEHGHVLPISLDSRAVQNSVLYCSFLAAIGSLN
jgi:hypothetical protein